MSSSTAEGTTSSISLTERINHATKDVHEKSGNSINWKLSLILTSRVCYCEAISLFWIVYAQIELLYQKHKSDHEALQKIQPVAVIFQRSTNFQKDIEYLMPNKEEANELMNRRCSKNYHNVTVYDPPVLQEYVDRLDCIAKENPIQLLAYMYAMYGAITGGGVAIQKMVQKTFGLKTTQGVTIFDINVKDTEYESGKEVWKDFKRIMDEEIAPELSAEEIQLILEEAPYVFINNNKLVATVERTRAFGKAAMDCTKRIGVSLAVAVAVIAVSVYYLKKE